uniref:Uncharacterized protein n=1 Tax=Trieres chinensis TaxID=1514140 RepID=A0A7S1Z397_TRICV
MRQQRRGLFMTSEGEGEKKDVAEPEAGAAEAEATEKSESTAVAAAAAATVTTGKESKGTEGGRSGALAALLLGPPLFAKFVIVLVVKFLTDLVVFPLLFLYRLVRLGKNKVLGLFGGGGGKGDLNGERINGEA